MRLKKNTLAHIVDEFKVYLCMEETGIKTMEEYTSLVERVYGGVQNVSFITLGRGVNLNPSPNGH